MDTGRITQGIRSISHRAAKAAPTTDVDPTDVTQTDVLTEAVGPTGVAVALARANAEMGPDRSLRVLNLLNQTDGFDCPGCAWPDPPAGERSAFEYCEEGAKAAADEATIRRVTPEFFAKHSVEELSTWSEYLLGQAGRLTHPMILREGATHYEAIDWDEAFALVGETLRGLDSPNEALFYTSGRASNEAAFIFQLIARALGTNNLPDCSNLCHESTSVALAQTIGIGKGSVSLEDLHEAELIVVVGQNPGTNHPRMLTALEKAKRNGATIVAVNTLPEAGLMRFKNPQRVRGVLGDGTKLADEFVHIRPDGDRALFHAIGHHLIKNPDSLDHDFISHHTTGFDAWADQVEHLDWDHIDAATGVDRAQIERVARMFEKSKATIVCWAMGVTQQRGGVETIKEIVNVILAQGNIGKPGAGVCPVRGHSNVQGDRTVGIWEKLPKGFEVTLKEEFGIEPPTEPGYNAAETVGALAAGDLKVFIGLGGNYAMAAPDTDAVHAGLRKTDLTVQLSTKLNLSHLVTGKTALILPVLGRTERDVTSAGEQGVTVEDSMSNVHLSRGRLAPASDQLRSEVAILCGIAAATFDQGAAAVIDWPGMAQDYSIVRTHIEHCVPGFEAYNAKVARPGGFILPHPPRDTRTFPTESGKAVFTDEPLGLFSVPDGHLILQGMRSHDQYNTTIYGHDDRYRGLKGGRRLVMVNPDDIAELGLSAGQLVDVHSVWDDNVDRVWRGVRLVAYPTSRGSAAAYFPEMNVLVPMGSTIRHSGTPTSKGVVVRLTPIASSSDADEHTPASRDATAQA